MPARHLRDGSQTEDRVTMTDGILATAVLAGLMLNAAGWWQADPAAGYVLAGYAVREVRGDLRLRPLRPVTAAGLWP